MKIKRFEDINENSLFDVDQELKDQLKNWLIDNDIIMTVYDKKVVLSRMENVDKLYGKVIDADEYVNNYIKLDDFTCLGRNQINKMYNKNLKIL